MKTYCIYAICMLLCIVGKVNAQGNTLPILLPAGNNQQTVQATTPDSIPVLTEHELAKITSIRSQFEKQNSRYARPIPLSNQLLRFLRKDNLDISDQARYWLNYMNNPYAWSNNPETQGEVPINSLFLPPILHGSLLPGVMPVDTIGRNLPANSYTFEPTVDSLFKDEKKRLAFEQSTYAYIRRNDPTLFRYSERDLPQESIQPVEIRKKLQEDLPVIVEKTDMTQLDDMDAPPKFIPERQYWQSGFESVIQFSQNYISPNWYKGGTSNLNLFTRNYMRYDYKKEKVQVTNEIELKINVYTAPKDTLRNYKMGDDLIRLHSNFGYLAFSKWYYTFDGEIKTQLFKNYKENTYDLQTALFSPFSVNLGLGMKYDLDKKFKDKYKSLKLSANLAPISYTFMYNYNDEVDLSRFGFEKKPDSDLYKNTLIQFGSTIRANLAVNFNRNVSWESRLYYFTNYHRVEAEFENTLRLAISRFFSTRIYVHLRFDDGVTKNPDFDSYFQVNELLSFGFNYKW